MDARSLCELKGAERARDLVRWELLAARIGFGRLVVAIGGVGLLAMIVWAPLPAVAWWGVGALFVLFVVLVGFHARVYEAKDRATAALQFYRKAIANLEGRWRESKATGERFNTADHPYAKDIDIFGPASLFQRMNWTSTRFGEAKLSDSLAGFTSVGGSKDLHERQEATRELALKTDFRERLFVDGARLHENDPEPSPLLVWAEGPAFNPPFSLRVSRWIFPFVTIVLLGFSPVFHVSRLYFLVPVMFGMAAAWPQRLRIAAILTAIGSHERALSRYAAMVSAIESERFGASRLRTIQDGMRGAAGEGATREIQSLANVTSWIDARNNEVFRLFIGPLLMWDVHGVFALEKWKARAGVRIRAWFEAIGEIEALASVGGFAFEEESFTYPQVMDSPVFDARGLGHPLLGRERRVSNDVTLPGPGSTLIVTGSNMSGKSTLLRAIGVNTVLALAGAPVCATSLTIGPVRLATSMRIDDSLTKGVSHFYVELQKLKMILDLADGGAGVLFLFDEILHGTNSRERLIGAREVIRRLIAKGALGAVSTHDIALSELEAEFPHLVRNVHFEEQVEGDEMTFDYQLRSGVVMSSNALRLMRALGIMDAI